MTITKNHIIKFFLGLLWVTVAVGCITLLLSAAIKKDAGVCNKIDINISGVNVNYFVDKNDIYSVISNYGGDSTLHNRISKINLRSIEKEIEKNVWIKNAELFFDNNNVLKVSVEEREPIARVFTVTGNTFYIDSSCAMLPVGNMFSVRLPIFSGFKSDAKILSKRDSAILVNIKQISLKIYADTFLMAMAEQIDITPEYAFEIVPAIGTQRILLGDGNDLDSKLLKLKLFYKNVVTKAGWNRYNLINLQYKDQVVATIRGAEDVKADSLRTLELMKFIAIEAAIKAADSSQVFIPEVDKSVNDSALVQQSFERDDESIGAEPLVVLPKTQPTITNIILPPITKIENTIKAKIETPKPVAKPIVKTAVKETKTTSKPVTKPAAAKVVQKPVEKKKPVLMPNKKPTNDY